MTDMNTGTAPATPTRPTFLTVLCILSFIGIAIGLWSNFTGYAAAKTAMATGADTTLTNAMDRAMDEAASDNKMSDSEREMANKIGSAVTGALGNPAGMATSYLVQGLMCILCLVGVLMMWNLKKTGFYIYTVAQLVIVAAPFIWVGGLAGGLMGILGAIFPIVFIILYGVNLKHMH